MMCNCNRAAYTEPRVSHVPAAVAAPVRPRAPLPNVDVRLVYTTPGAIVLRGPITGRSYHFRHDARDGTSVDPRDVPSLLATRIISRLT
jgi:hypothetical protein